MRRRRRLPAVAFATSVVAALILGGCVAESAPAPVPAALRMVGVAAPLDVREVYLRQRVAVMTLEQKVATLVMVHVPGTDAAVVRSVVDAHGFGGVILMGDNVGGPAGTVASFTRALSSEAGLPLLTAIDQEGGVVRRLREDQAAAARELRGQDASVTEQAFRIRSSLVAEAGVLINFGIVADVTADPSSFIHSRVLGETPSAAAERVAAAVRGELGTVLSTLKHFPGHGASPDDSHVSIPRAETSLAEWRVTHALPFEAGIDAGAPLIMTGHLLFDQISPLPASLSPRWVSILRDDLDFTGVIVTDDLLMLQRSGVAEYANPVQNAIQALVAGNDLLLFVLPADPSSVGVEMGGLVAALAGAVLDGRLDEARINESLHRVLSLRRDASGLEGPFVDCGPKCRGESPRASALLTAPDERE